MATTQEIQSIVTTKVAEVIGSTPEEVAAAPEASLIGDLGMTSIQIFPLISELEDQLDVEIDFAEFLTKAKTVGGTVEFIASL